MNCFVPDDWRTVDESDFEEFLKSCEDYRVDGWYNGILYHFRRTGKRFAFRSHDGKLVRVDPKLLVPQ